jgi:hypothetical protein
MQTIAALVRRGAAGFAVLMVTLVLLPSCGGDLTLPGPGESGVDLKVVDGNQQVGTVGEPLPRPLVVRVATDADAPIEGRRVAFVSSGGAGRFDPEEAETDSDGEAHTSWVLGTAPGPYTGEARLVTAGDSVVATIPIEAAAVAGEPDTLRALSPLSRVGRRNQTLDEPLVVLAVDRFGNPVEGAEVRWEVTSGGGEVSEEDARTAADGTSSVTWTLGGGIGLQRVTAAVGGAEGSPVTFTATVLF